MKFTFGYMAAIPLLALAGTASAVVTQNGVAFYDSASNANAVDTSATVDGASTVSLATFTADVAAAHAAGVGGVVNFDGVADGTVDTVIDAVFASKTVTITNANPSNDGYAFENSLGSCTPISGSEATLSNMLASQSDNDDPAGREDYAFSFDAADKVVAVGLTVLSRDSAFSFPATYEGTVTFSDSTTVSVSSSVAKGDGTDDTFFGFRSSTDGVYITGLELDGTSTSGNAGAVPFTAVDDLGIITIPEPGSMSLLAIGGLVALARRKR